MSRLVDFRVDDLAHVTERLHTAAGAATSMEEAATAVVDTLYTELRADDGPGCALARLYITTPFRLLPPDLQEFAEAVAPAPLAHDVRCLTLLATAGTAFEWNDRRRSRDHQAIPLSSAAAVEQSPMIARLFSDMGVDVETVVRPDPALLIASHQRLYNVFFVEEAAGHPSIPAQETFVIPHGIRSVIGLGGVLPSGDTYATILFTTVPVPAPVADVMRSLAITIKAVLVPHTFKVFARPGP